MNNYAELPPIVLGRLIGRQDRTEKHERSNAQQDNAGNAANEGEKTDNSENHGGKARFAQETSGDGSLRTVHGICKKDTLAGRQKCRLWAAQV